MEDRTGRVFLLIIFASLCYLSMCSKIIIVPNSERCKVLNHTFVQSFTCRAKNVNRTLNLSSKELIFRPGVSLSNYHSHVVFYRKFTTVYRQFMIDVHFDSCALRAGKKVAFTQFLNIEPRLEYGNYWEPCPISGRRYELNVPNNLTLLDIFPSGEYRVDTKAYTIVDGEIKYLILSQRYGEVKYTTIEYWKKR